MRKCLLKRISAFSIFAIMFTLLFPYGAGIANAAEFTSAKLALSRVQATTQATNTWTIVLPASVSFDGTTDDELLIDYSTNSVTFAAFGTWVVGDFALTETTTGSITIGGITAAAGTFTYPACTAGANDVVVAVDTTALKIGLLRCTGAAVDAATLTLTISNRITNGAANLYTIAVSHEEDCAAGCTGAANDNTINAAIDIIADDQIGTSATVNPTLDFEMSIETALCTATSGLAAAGTLSMGALSSESIGRYGFVCTRLDTNATDGASIYVTSTNGALISTSQTADLIPDTADTALSEQTISAGTEEYGLCIDTDGAGSGIGTAGTGTTLAKDTEFDSDANTCTNAGGSKVGELTTATEQVWSINGPAVNAFANLHVFAAVSAVTEAHTDYADTLTFTVASTF